MSNNQIVYDINKTVCFTGHRPDKLGGFDINNHIAQKIKLKLKEAIIKSINDGFDTFISGGALGVDQYAAEIVISLKNDYPHIKLVIARPFPSQEKIWNQQSKKLFHTICSKADFIVDVSPDPYSAWKMQVRNEYMIKNSSLLIAVYDGSDGGTGNTVKFAIKKNKKIIYINPKDFFS